MPTIRTLLTALIAMLVMTLAHELCFEDTTFGGYLPFLTMVIAPLLAYALGVQEGASQAQGDVETVAK